MIYGEIKELGKYKGISKNLDTAIDFILEGKYKNGVVGKNIVDGEKVYFNQPDSPMTKELAEGFIENHRKYIDIHMVIEGEEKIGYISNTDIKLTKEYDDAGDYELYEGELENLFYLDPKKYIILFPGEPHMALIKGGEETKKIKKVIFKVLVD
ncbi:MULTISPECIES: YhcH/YjgK/YiaL family protein [unclassified Fusobacterium]|uniref:YhcH/YjgK/YiaL family protein n=1 Tax=unclassified Fusobacterium TaxID=2648384 RepID=UPI0025C0EB84|nr:YhcH/YjgK/YiaL family protein [Fusobacterium sp.]